MSKPRSDSTRKQQVTLAGLFLVWLLVISVHTAWGGEPYSIEAAELQAADLPQSIASNLNAQGLRIFTYSEGLKMSICEIFWATTVTAQDGRLGLGRASYDNLKSATLLGVLRFLPEA